MNRKSILFIISAILLLISIPLGIYLIQQTQIFKPRAGGGEQIIAADNFNRTSSITSLGTADSGQVWTADKGVWGISNNFAYSVTSCPAPGYATVNTGLTDGTYQISIPINKQDMIIPFRFIDTNNLYQIVNGGPLYKIEKKVNGTISLLAEISGITPTDNDIIIIKLSGDQITITVLPVTGTKKEVTVSDSSLKGTKYGIGNWCNNTVRFKDMLFVVNTTPSPSPTPFPSPTGNIGIGTSNPYQTKVLVIKYFPTDSTGLKLDPNIAGTNETITNIRAKVDSLNNQAIQSLTNGTKYHGYKDANAPASLSYSITDSKEFLEPLPLGLKIPGGSTYRPDYKKILNNNNICNYVDNLGVKQVWFWGYHYGSIEPVESNMSMGTTSRAFWTNSTFGDISNSERTDDLPICQKTYVLYNYNFTRGLGEMLEDHGHHLESVMNFVDYNLFWQKWVRPYGLTNNQLNHCGWTHSPPNTNIDYLWNSEQTVKSDCEDWKPEGGGQIKDVNCHTWFGSQCKDNGGVEYKIWWMQNLPGYNNNLTYQGKKLRNWWEFYGDLDLALAKGKTAFEDLPTPTPSPSNAPKIAEYVEFRVNNKLSLINIATNNSVSLTLNGTVNASSATDVATTILYSDNSLDQYSIRFNYIPKTIPITSPSPSPSPSPILRPTISNVSTSSARPGDVITISGDNFLPSGADIRSLQVMLIHPDGGVAFLASVLGFDNDSRTTRASWQNKAISFTIGEVDPQSGQLNVQVNNLLATWPQFLTITSVPSPTPTPSPSSTPPSPTPIASDRSLAFISIGGKDVDLSGQRSITLSASQPGQEYKVQLFYKDGGYKEEYINLLNKALTQPALLKILDTKINLGQKEIYFGWNNIPQAEYYIIQGLDSNNIWQGINGIVNTQNTYTFKPSSYPASLKSYRLRVCIPYYCYYSNEVPFTFPNSTPIVTIPSSSPNTNPSPTPIPSPSPTPVKSLILISIAGSSIDLINQKPTTIRISSQPNIKLTSFVNLSYSDNTSRQIPLVFIYNPTPTPSPSITPKPSLNPSDIGFKISSFESIGNLYYQIKFAWNIIPGAFYYNIRSEFIDEESKELSGLGIAEIDDPQQNSYTSQVLKAYLPSGSKFILEVCGRTRSSCIDSLPVFPNIPINSPSPTPHIEPPIILPSPEPLFPIQAIKIGKSEKDVDLAPRNTTVIPINLESETQKQGDSTYFLGIKIIPRQATEGVTIQYTDVIKFIYKPQVTTFSASCENGVLTATWPKVAGATSYEVRGARSINDRPDDPTWNSIPQSEKISASNLTDCSQTSCSYKTDEKALGGKFLPGEIYYLWYHSRNASGELSEANKLTAPIACQPAKSTTSPPQFTSASCKNGTLSFSWTGGGPRYEIRVANGLNINQVLDPNIWGKTRPNQLDLAENDYEGNSVSYNVGSNGQQYTIWIHSDDNNILSDRVFYPFYLRCDGESNVPKNLAYQCLGNSKVKLSWDAVSNSSKYLIRADNKDSSWGGYNIQPGDIVEDNVLENSYTATITPNAPYTFWVQSMQNDIASEAGQFGKNFSCP